MKPEPEKLPASSPSTTDAQRLWETVLGELQVSVEREQFRTWLSQTTGLELAAGRLLVGAPTEFVVRWLDGRLRVTIERAVEVHAGSPLSVQFRVVGPAVVESARDQAAHPSSRAAASPERPPLRRPPLLAPHFDPRYAFEAFVVGSSNKLAFTAARTVAERPATIYNPLFVYGGVGLGKTHLLHAVGHVALANGHTVIYASSEQFTNEFINSLRERSTEEFRQKYRSADFLLIDDIQFISGKEQTQEEFFHTFNDLYTRHKQIVLTSDRSPKLLPGIEDRLRSRFEWGLIADIQPPALETRIAILRSKVAEQKLLVPDAVVTFIASRVQDNIRELEGSLNRVVAYSQLMSSPITTELTAQALAGLLNARRSLPQPQAVLEAVQRLFRVAGDELTGPRRDQKIAYARHLAMYLIYEDCRRSLTETGRFLGNRDHSTILHGYTKIARLLTSDSAVRQDITELREVVNGSRR